MKSSLSIAFVALTASSFALDTKPWLADAYAFSFQSAFCYSRFNKVEGASRQLSAPENNRDLSLDLGFTTQSLDFQVEGEFGKTKISTGPFAAVPCRRVIRCSMTFQVIPSV